MEERDTFELKRFLRIHENVQLEILIRLHIIFNDVFFFQGIRHLLPIFALPGGTKKKIMFANNNIFLFR